MCEIPEDGRSCTNYTTAGSTAIKATGSTTWVRDHEIIPKGEAWNRCLEEAESYIDDKQWDCEGALDRCLAESRQGG